MSNHPDHPYVRALRECPVCDMRKEFGRLTCAPCWATSDPDFVLRKVDAREREIGSEHSQFGVGA